MGKDVIIIGGGLGGLVSACLLCKEGYKVTILERHSKIGGGLHCFERYGALFETGIHYISGFQKGGVLEKIFSYIGIFDKLNIRALDSEGFDRLHIGSDNKVYRFGIGKQNFIQLISEEFPEEKENIQRYMDAIYQMCNAFQLYNLEPVSNPHLLMDDNFLVGVGKFIETFTSNYKLGNILAWNNNLYAGDKLTSPIYIHALITKFYIEGASRFVGGSQQLADAMVEFIESQGGAVFCSSSVCKIEILENKVTMVRTSDDNIFSADVFISDIHPVALFDMIDSLLVRRSFRNRLHSLNSSYSMFIIYILAKKDTFPYLNFNYFYHSDYESIWKSAKYQEGSFPEGFILITPPKAGKNDYADTIVINCVMNFDDVRQWEHTTRGNRGESYKAFKRECEAKILDKVEIAFPTIRSVIDKSFCATPLTIRDYSGSKEGSIYGFEKDCHDIVKSHIFARTKFENLFLTGQNINLHGILGVPLNAITTVGELTGLNYLIEKINHNYQEKN